jgi:hypothetical protein
MQWRNAERRADVVDRVKVSPGQLGALVHGEGLDSQPATLHRTGTPVYPGRLAVVAIRTAVRVDHGDGDRANVVTVGDNAPTSACEPRSGHPGVLPANRVHDRVAGVRQRARLQPIARSCLPPAGAGFLHPGYRDVAPGVVHQVDTTEPVSDRGASVGRARRGLLRPQTPTQELRRPLQRATRARGSAQTMPVHEAEVLKGSDDRLRRPALRSPGVGCDECTSRLGLPWLTPLGTFRRRRGRNQRGRTPLPDNRPSRQMQVYAGAFASPEAITQRPMFCSPCKEGARQHQGSDSAPQSRLEAGTSRAQTESRADFVPPGRSDARGARETLALQAVLDVERARAASAPVIATDDERLQVVADP